MITNLIEKNSRKSRIVTLFDRGEMIKIYRQKHNQQQVSIVFILLVKDLVGCFVRKKELSKE